MTLRLKLESFDAPEALGTSANANVIAVENLNAQLEQKRLEGYEAGYRAGWDDATEGQTKEAARVQAEFARNLEDLGFTFQEARSHVLSSLEPLLKTMVQSILPSVVEASIGHIIADAVVPLAAQAADAPIQVLVAQGERDTLVDMLDAAVSVPFEVVEQEHLPEGQIYLRSGATERKIDLSGALSKMQDAVGALYELKEKDFGNERA